MLINGDFEQADSDSSGPGDGDRRMDRETLEDGGRFKAELWRAGKGSFITLGSHQSAHWHPVELAMPHSTSIVNLWLVSRRCRHFPQILEIGHWSSTTYCEQSLLYSSGWPILTGIVVFSR